MQRCTEVDNFTVAVEVSQYIMVGGYSINGFFMLYILARLLNDKEQERIQVSESNKKA